MVPSSPRNLTTLTQIAVIGAALLVAACGAGPGPPAGATATAATATPTAVPATATPVPTPTTLPSEAAAAFTTDDTAIAKIIKDSADEAVPKLETVSKMSLEQQAALFLPVRMWITVQLDHVAALTPSGCTTDAVHLFKDGMARYKTIAQDFLDWREWGAAGLPYTLSEPKRAAKLLTDAVAALETHCPLPA
jgi:hypothetical protein